MLTTLITQAPAAVPLADPAAPQQQEPPAAPQQPANTHRRDDATNFSQGTATSQEGDLPEQQARWQQPNSAATPQRRPPPPPLPSTGTPHSGGLKIAPVSKARLVPPKVPQSLTSRTPPEPSPAPATLGGTTLAPQRRATLGEPLLRYSFSEHQPPQQPQTRLRREPTKCTTRSTRDQAHMQRMGIQIPT